MSNEKRNLLIGQGENLFQGGVWPSSRGGKPDPYSISQQRSLLLPVLERLATNAAETSRGLAPRGEIAAKFTVHCVFR